MNDRWKADESGGWKAVTAGIREAGSSPEASVTTERLKTGENEKRNVRPPADANI
jgi:hypothetical protein